MRNAKLVSAFDDRIVYGQFAISSDESTVTFDWRFDEATRLYKQDNLRCYRLRRATGTTRQPH